MARADRRRMMSQEGIRRLKDYKQLPKLRTPCCLKRRAQRPCRPQRATAEAASGNLGAHPFATSTGTPDDEGHCIIVMLGFDVVHPNLFNAWWWADLVQSMVTREARKGLWFTFKDACRFVAHLSKIRTASQRFECSLTSIYSVFSGATLSAYGNTGSLVMRGA